MIASTVFWYIIARACALLIERFENKFQIDQNLRFMRTGLQIKIDWLIQIQLYFVKHKQASNNMYVDVYTAAMDKDTTTPAAAVAGTLRID